MQYQFAEPLPKNSVAFTMSFGLRKRTLENTINAEVEAVYIVVGSVQSEDFEK